MTTLVIGELSWFIYIISLKNIHMNMIKFCLVCLAVISIFWSRYWLPSAPPSLGNKISAVRYLTIWFLFLWYNLTTIYVLIFTWKYSKMVQMHDEKVCCNLQFKRRHQYIWVCVVSAQYTDDADKSFERGYYGILQFQSFDINSCLLQKLVGSGVIREQSIWKSF